MAVETKYMTKVFITIVVIFFFNAEIKQLLLLCKVDYERNSNKRAQRALERSPESEDFKEFPFFIALYTTGDTWGSKSEVMFKK